MLTLTDVAVVARREVLRTVRSGKGIALFALFLLGGCLVPVLRVILTRRLNGASDEDLHRGYIAFLATMFKDDAIVQHLSHAPVMVFVLFQGTLTFLPFFVLMMGFDGIAGELQHRTVRYSSTRASLASIIVGKATGLWILLSIMVTVLHLTVWGVALANDPRDGGAILSWGGRFLLFSRLAGSAYAGFTTFMSTLWKTPAVALFAGGGIGFALWLLHWRLGESESTEKLTWLFPNRYETLLYSPDGGSVALALLLLFVWGTVMVASAWLVLSRRGV